jgi:tRNA threonylcarbamoyladenosine biosynthesis protein TsaB
MLILAFDTTDEHGGAGIFRDAECVASASHEGPPDYSVTLFQEVTSILEKAQVQFGDIELFAVASGPGSFTGIRVGLAAAQGWASTFRRPIRGVSVLEAMVDEVHPETPLAAAVLDARREEFYCALFRRAQTVNSFEPAGDGYVLKAEELSRFLQSHAPGPDSLTCVMRREDAAAGRLQPSLSAYHWQSASGPLMPAIARVALRSFQEKRPPSPHEVYPYYIRRPDAELARKD